MLLIVLAGTPAYAASTIVVPRDFPTIQAAVDAAAPGTTQAKTFHVHVLAVAELLSSTCPFGDWLPQTDTICED